MKLAHLQSRFQGSEAGPALGEMPFTLDEVREILLVEAERIANSREEAETLANDALAEAIVHYGAPRDDGVN